MHRTFKSTSTIGVLVLFGAALMLSGCGSKPKPEPTVSVRGQILLEGNPVASALVVFHPTDGSDLCAYARTDASGNFTLSTYVQNDGARPGNYVVTVIKYDDREGVNHLPSLYDSPKTSLIRIEVKDEPNELRPIQLHR